MMRNPPSSGNSCCDWQALLWRLRRATAIETGLLQIQSEILREATHAPQSDLQRVECTFNSVMQFKGLASDLHHHDAGNDQFDDQEGTARPYRRLIAQCFLRLTNVDNGAFERIGRYEAMLWRQARQIFFTLEVLRRKNLNEIGRIKPTDCGSDRLR